MLLTAKRLLSLLMLGSALAAPLALRAETPAAPPPAPAPAALSAEQALLSDIRQLTFVGKRAGEGYFSPNGSMMIFQSEREPGNPFYQMYVVNRDTGDLFRASPGYGKASCGWINPVADKVIFASTQDDPRAKEKQEAELALRASGKTRPYAWDFDDQYEIYDVDMASGNYTNLTRSPGYDAEGAYSPDGREIVFASNRDAYTRALSPEERQQFEQDPAAFMDIYVMNADGSNLRRLTDAPGYDGGPFFSADGRKIVWRRFALDGRTAEVFTMNADGSDQKQITHSGLMSWAPFFHPSGDYIVFASDRYGRDNFELFIVDAEGRHEPVRVTDSAGFDGLPAFSPDGLSLAWTSKRSADGTAQLFMAAWNDARARELLGMTQTYPARYTEAKPPCGVCQARLNHLRWHVATLASDEMQGRLAGTPGEQRATQYVADVFKLMGLEPAGDDGSYFQSFEFTSGVKLGDGNSLRLDGLASADLPALKVDTSWRPLSFSATGDIVAAPVAFAGYGIEAPAGKGGEGYDSYANADVSGKWVLMFRGLPADIAPARRLQLSQYADEQYKAAVAKAKGAAGVIFAPAPGVAYQDQLVKLSQDAVAGKSSLPAISIDKALFDRLTALLGNGFSEVLKALDAGDKMRATDIPGVRLAATIDVVRETRTGRNVLGRLRVGSKPELPPLVVGAHVDHLGTGNVSGSLAREDEKGLVHYGADDNASGVAALLEIAEGAAGLAGKQALTAQRDVIFAAWSGEELGLLGSQHFVDALAEAKGVQDLSPYLAAYLNMDMIGRLDKRLYLYGAGTSTVWSHLVERANLMAGLMIELVNDGYVSSDATSFYLKGVPVLHAHTGPTEDYSTPRDTADKVNYIGLAKTTTLIDGIMKALIASDRSPDYLRIAKAEHEGARRRSGIFLGTIPDYAAADGEGVKLSGVMKDGPAEKAGLVAGDVIVALADMPIANIYDYVRAINMLKAGEEIKVAIQRDGKREERALTPAVRE
jgi:Tol biopolymer transport system component